MAIFAEYLSEEEADLLLVVLAASEIPHWIHEGQSGISIFVRDEDFTKAQTAIEKYVAENPQTEQAVFFRQRTSLPSNSAVWICAVLFIIHGLITWFGVRKQIFQLYGASASDILSGELYRTVTALMLHSGILHLVANVAGLAIFGTALCKVTGGGVGWSLIVFSGVMGNLLNAWFYKSGHLSVGASTALFGAIGLVAVEHVIWKTGAGERRARAWLPMGAGLALLGIMGASQQTDLMAHFFGFLSGSAISVLYFLYIFKPIFQSRHIQIRCAVVLAIIAAVSWLAPLL